MKTITLEQAKINLANYQNNYAQKQIQSIKGVGTCGAIFFAPFLLILEIATIVSAGIVAGLFYLIPMAVVVLGVYALNKHNQKKVRETMVKPEDIKLFGAICKSINETKDVNTGEAYFIAEVVPDGSDKTLLAYVKYENGQHMHPDDHIVVANLPKFYLKYFAEKVVDAEFDRLDVFEE